MSMTKKPRKKPAVRHGEWFKKPKAEAKRSRTPRWQAPMMLRLMRHHDHANDPITEIHCWIATYRDGHEEILLFSADASIGPSMGPVAGSPWPIKDKKKEVTAMVKAFPEPPVSVRLASFYAGPTP